MKLIQLRKPIKGKNVFLVPYTSEVQICKRFSKEDWHKIADDIDNDEELSELFIQYPHLIQGFILNDNIRNQPIGFCYILKERNARNAVSFHGGGWNQSVRMSILYVEGTILLIEYLLKLGYKVRTYCSIDNLRAYKFMHGLGFVCYRKTSKRIYQWINLKRLYRNPIYNILIKRYD